MKYVTYLAVCLVMLLAAPVVWAGQVGHTVDMPEFLTANVSFNSPIVAAHCRDVNHVHNLLYTKQIGADAVTFYTLETKTWKKAGNLLAGITGYINHKGAAVLTDKTTSLTRRSTREQIEKTCTEKIEISPLAGGIV